MKSRKTKTATKKMWTSDPNFTELLKYLKAMYKAARTKPSKKTRSNDLPRTVRVTTEYLNALRRAVGQLIDPETTEVNWWHVEVLDPYGDYAELPPHYQCTGREHFARAPGTDVWIASRDLSEATYKRLCELHSDKARNSGDRRTIRYQATKNGRVK
jgi:hypothetical protein